ncbi:MAG TPA: metal ABC transporter permease [Solirubrobacteraceae bacterium]|nr:metal ABC transporter permease [Solirubrobacteraceae bacterium]
MLGHEYVRNALLAGSFVALACGLCGWFVVLRGQVFAGDALGHVAFPGALAAAAAGVDERIGLFAATIAAGGAIALLGRGAIAARGRASGAEPADDTTIGVAFTAILALGVFFLTRFSLGSGGGAGIVAAHTLFGSIFGLSAGEARLAAAIGAAVVVLLALLGRPLLFASVAPEIAGARGVPTRLLGFAFLALLGVVAAEASQAVGALLLLGLLAGPAAAAHRLLPAAGASLALAGALAVGSLWGGVALAYAIPSLPPSTAVVAVATGVYALARLVRGGGGAHR